MYVGQGSSGVVESEGSVVVLRRTSAVEAVLVDAAGCVRVFFPGGSSFPAPLSSASLSMHAGVPLSLTPPNCFWILSSLVC